MPMIAPIAAIIGTAIGVGGQIMAGQAQAKQGRQMQQAEDYNAQVSRQNAQAIQQSGKFEQDKAKRQQLLFTGRQRALTAASGVQFSGSPLDVMSDSIAESEMDMAAMRYNTDVASSRALDQADYSTQLGKNYNEMGKIGRMESYVKAGSTLLSEGANTAYRYKSAFKKPSLSLVE